MTENDLIVVFSISDYQDLKCNGNVLYIDYMTSLYRTNTGQELVVEASSSEMQSWLYDFKAQLETDMDVELTEYSNLLFANIVRPLLFSYYAILHISALTKFNKVILKSKIANNYLPISAGEGDNTKRLLWYRDIFYATFLDKQLPFPVEHSGQSFYLNLISACRPYIVMLSKLVLSFKNFSFIDNTGSPKFKSLLIARNKRTIENFISYNKAEEYAVLFYPQLKFKRNELSKTGFLLKNTLRSFFHFGFSLFKKSEESKVPSFSFFKGKVSIDIRKIKKNIKLEMADKELYRITLGNFFINNKQIKKVYSYEMVNPTAFIESSVINTAEFNIIQSATLDFRRIVMMPKCSRFFVSSKYELKVLNENFPKSRAGYAQQISQSLNKHIKNKYNTLPKVVTYFSQPFPMPEKHNYIIINELVELSAEYGFRILVKPHPRDLADYSGFNVSIVMDSSEELILKSDLVISRTSTVLNESLNLNVPYLAILLNNNAKTLDTIYLSSEIEAVRIESIELVRGVFENYKGFLTDFYNQRELIKLKYLS